MSGVWQTQSESSTEWHVTKANLNQLNEFSNRNLFRQQRFRIVNLKDYLNLFGGYLSEIHAKYILLQIILDVQYISSQGFNFVDIEPTKILINIKNKTDIQQHEVVLSNQVQKWKQNSQKQTKKQLSRFWSKNGAPEVLVCGKQELRDHSYIDVWNIGVIAYYILTGQEPFLCSSDAKQGRYKLPTNFNLSVDSMDFISKTLFAYPVNARMNLVGLQFLPWFKNSEIDKMKKISIQSRHNYLLRDNYKMNDLYNVINESSEMSLSSVLEPSENQSSFRSSCSLKLSFEKFSENIEKILQNLQSEEKYSAKNLVVNKLEDKNGSTGTACRVSFQV